MSVLVVSNFLSAVGKSRGYAEDLADRLEASGHAVVRTSAQPGRARRMLDMMQSTWRERDRYHVAIVDVFSGPSFVWAEAVAFELRRLAKPYVLVLHGGSLPEFAQRWPRRVRRLLARAAHVIAPSGYLADALRPYRADIDVLPNATDVSRYTFAVRTRPSPRIVWVRAFHEIYNPVLAIDVLAQVAARHSDATLTMVGPDKDGSLRSVEERAKQLAVRDRLEIVGGVASTEVASYLAKADVFLNTTNIDNTPLSVLEAMATGLCIVSTAVGGIPHLLRDGDTALLVPPRDATAMATAVDRVLTDPALATRLSQRARDAATERDWIPVLARWARLIDGVSAHA